jgi:streptogramin lyase
VIPVLRRDAIAGDVDGPALTAKFRNPRDLIVDSAGNIFVADKGNDKIRKIDTSGNVTTFAGTGSPGYVDGGAV